MATIQLKRGTAEALTRVNPLLAAGEPCFVTDENRFKIGDGENRWNDLPYMGESCVVNGLTFADFPEVGRINVIYKAEAEKCIYQWNTAKNAYELLGSTEISGDLSAITIIHGGGAVLE